MRTNELISIIVPIYGVEKYLNKSIKSIVEQTYENLEIILVDDGSLDNCATICDEWAKKDKRIKVIHKVNGGIADARNVGIAAASGDYIGFVDSDDYIEKEMYEKLYRTIKQENADIVMCNLEKLEENGTKILLDSPIKNEIFDGKEAIRRISGDYSWYYIVLWNKLYARDILGDIVFPMGKIHEDEFVFHRIYFKCDKIISIGDKLYNYIRRNGSIMTGAEKIRHLDAVEAICDRIEFLKAHGLMEYYPLISERIKKIYHYYRLELSFGEVLINKKRVKEIDRLFKKNYFDCNETINLKEKIKYTFPIVWCILYRQKCKIRQCLKKKEKML